MKVWLLFSICCAIAKIGYSQDTVPELIIIDFLHPHDVGRYKTARYGSQFVVRIDNINRNLYKINEAFLQRDFNTTLPALFSGIELPGYLTLSLPDVFATVDEISLLPSLVNGNIEIDKNLKVIYKSSEFIGSAVPYNNSLVNAYQSCDEPYSTLQDEVIKTTHAFLPSSYAETRQEQARGIKAELDKSVAAAVTAKKTIEQRIPAYMGEIREQIEINDDLIWEWDKFPLDKKHPGYRDGLTRYRSAKKKVEAYKAQRDSTMSIIKKAFNLVTSLEKFRNDNRIQQIVNNYRLINESNFTYYSDTVTVTGDEVKLSIDIDPAKVLPCEGRKNLVIEETYRTRGGWKVDFSTGLFMNGGTADFLGNEFQYNQVNDSTTIIQRKDGGAKLLLSVGAFMHLYRRSGTNFNVAISPGLSTTTAFDGLNIHLGGSAIFGRRERLVVSAGATAREVEVLDNHFVLNRAYSAAELPDAVPTVKVFPKFGWFVSITYNWSRLKKN